MENVWSSLSRLALLAAGCATAGYITHLCTKRRRRGQRLKLLIHNIQKRQNIGSLIRVCVAMGVDEVILVGKQSKNTFGMHGSFGTDKQAKFAHPHTLKEARDYLKNDGFDIVGVEIMPEARRLCGYWPLPFASGWMTHPWGNRDVCFVMGNEGQGMHETLKAVCDWFIYIPQYSQGTASLNVCTAAAIILHEFARARCGAEAAREGEKFVVEKPPTPFERYQAMDPTLLKAQRDEREAKKQAAADAAAAAEELDSSWLDAAEEGEEGGEAEAEF